MLGKPATPEACHKQCEERLEKLFVKGSQVDRMLSAIEKLGCSIPPTMFSCESCEGDVTGGFLVKQIEGKEYSPKIVICENKQILTKEEFESVVLHELVHAYDKCRAKLDITSCPQHACTEIRAAALSGECSYIKELLRRGKVLPTGHQECVKRRATLSIKMNPNCANNPEKCIDAVFEKCFNDREPFNE